MPDIKLVPVNTIDVMSFDWLQTPAGLLEEDAEIITAFLVAIFSDAAADANDALPDPRSNDRRGWWGDDQAAEIWNGWPLGSKLWLLTRAKIVDQMAREGATIARVQQYLYACLTPFVTAGICSKVLVTASQDTEARIVATATMFRGPKSAIALQFAPLWSELFPGSALANAS